MLLCQHKPGPGLPGLCWPHWSSKQISFQLQNHFSKCVKKSPRYFRYFVKLLKFSGNLQSSWVNQELYKVPENFRNFVKFLILHIYCNRYKLCWLNNRHAYSLQYTHFSPVSSVQSRPVSTVLWCYQLLLLVWIFIVIN